MELLNEHIEIASLVTEVHSESHGVIDHEKGESYSDSKRTGTDSFVVSNRGEKRNRERCVGTGHMTVSDEVFPLPTMPETKEYKLDKLRHETYRNRDDEDGVFLDEVLHMPLVYHYTKALV